MTPNVNPLAMVDALGNQFIEDLPDLINHQTMPQMKAVIRGKEAKRYRSLTEVIKFEPENPANIKSIMPLPMKMISGMSHFRCFPRCSGFHEVRMMAGIERLMAMPFCHVKESDGSNRRKSATGITILNFAAIEVTVTPIDWVDFAIN